MISQGHCNDVQLELRIGLSVSCNVATWCVQVKVHWWKKDSVYSVAISKIVRYDTYNRSVIYSFIVYIPTEATKIIVLCDSSDMSNLIAELEPPQPYETGQKSRPIYAEQPIL